MPPFGFGLSIASLRGVSAPVAPEILMYDPFASVDAGIDGRSPAANGGIGASTWEIDTNFSYMTIATGEVRASGDFAAVYYLAQYSNGRFSTVINPTNIGGYDVPITLRAKANSIVGANNYYEATFSTQSNSVILTATLDSGIVPILAFVFVDVSNKLAEIQVVGQTIKVFVNSVEVISHTDTENYVPNAGYWGFTLSFVEYAGEGYGAYCGPATLTTA